MVRKKQKPLPILENVLIDGKVSRGRAVTRIDGKVLFVDGAVPGDTGDIQVYKKKKNFLEGRLVTLKEPSPLRVKAPCIHFGPCGGCKWQHLEYSAQLTFKQDEVKDSLERIAGLQVEINPILPSRQIFQYRNKLDFAFSSSRWLTTEEIASGEEFNRSAVGFHPAGRFDKVIDITDCLLQPEPSNAIRNALREYALERNLRFYDVRKHEGFLRNIILRSNLRGEFMVLLAFAENNEAEINAMVKFISSRFPEVVTILHTINQKQNDSIYDLEFQVHKGAGYLVEEMEGLKFRIGPKSFYQTNPAQAYELYKIVRDFAALKGSETVYDLYTGTGTIAAFIGREAGKVIGIESVPEAVEDARLNASLNGFSNLHFEAGDMRKMLDATFTEKYGRPDVIITDPPRVGMHEDVVKTILQLMPERIVYVSCNPASQARDLIILKEGFEVEQVQPVDMFPHTYHVENVVLLRRRNIV